MKAAMNTLWLLLSQGTAVVLCAGCGTTPDNPISFTVRDAELTATWVNDERKHAQVRVTAEVESTDAHPKDVNGMVFIRPILSFSGKPLFTNATCVGNSQEVPIAHGKGRLLFYTGLDEAALKRCENRINALDVTFEGYGWLAFRNVAVFCDIQRKTLNTTSDGIRQPADGSPKPSR